jgi:malate dehydrogenase (oxaloacetate-decarboxylating)
MPPLNRYYDVKRDADGDRYLEVYTTGILLQRIPLLNKGTAFTKEERRLLELDGLLPPRVVSLETQKERLYRRYRLQSSALEKHIYLRNLQDRNEVLFYALLADHVEEMLPIIYTPTVGEAVRWFSHIYRLPRGLTVSTENIDTVSRSANNFPLNDVKLAVATDSSAILGIGDQGYGGMAIAIGKLSIYTVAGGIAPDRALAIELDVGTDREDLLADPLYLGVDHRRLKGEPYFHLMDKFVDALLERYPDIVIQWEDFSKDTAFDVLARYRDRLPSFNDDIQGTGAVALAGLLTACRMKGESITDQRVVVHGAGAGGIGVATAIAEGMKRAGLSEEQAKGRVCVLDSRGLLVEGRSMDAAKRPFAQPRQAVESWDFDGEAPNLLEVIRESEATVLLGLSGQGQAFDQSVVKAVAKNTGRPVVFPMSNPTSSSEAIPEDVLRWTGGKAIVATGSPFDDVNLSGKTYPIGQGNNAFIFPGLGFGIILSKASVVTDDMVLAAAYALDEYTDISTGRVYPPVDEMKDVSLQVAAAVMEQAVADGVTREPRIDGLDHEGLMDYAQKRFWEPKYLPFVRADRPE